jgi:acyl-CoA synthetase (NDP forming)
MGLDRLLRPKSIAVIGGGTWCANVIEQCRKFGFTGAIYPVHPTKDSINGVACFRCIADLPEPPDACFIGINRFATIKAVGELQVIGAGGAVCFASGFMEAIKEDADGINLQAQLLDAAKDMTIIGPNCYGFINYLDGALLWPDQHGGVHVDGGVAIITQSSNIAISITMQQRGLPIAYVVTAGNQAQTGLSEIGAALLEDPRVTALGLHIEGIDDLRAFATLAATARNLGKPIVVLKVGKSRQAQVATISHTASLAGSKAGATALFQRLGMAEVNTLPEFLESLKLLHVTGPLASHKIASMSCSGGEASLMADSALGRDVKFPGLTASQIKNLRGPLGSMVNLSNPLDYHTYIWDDVNAMTATFTAMMAPHLALGLVVADFPRIDRCDPVAWDCVIAAVEAAGKASGRPMGIVASLPENMPETVALDLVAKGIVPFCGLDEALAAVDVAAYCGQKQTYGLPVTLPKQSKNPQVLTEADAKALLAGFAVLTPKSRTANSLKELAQVTAKINFPVVLKGLGIAHKSEAGAVVLNLTSDAAVMKAAETMPADRFLVEEMVTGAVAELLVGVVLDTAHGYVLTIAAGGILTELLTDSVSLLLPSTHDDIALAIGDLRIAKLLNGFRGQPTANIKAIVDTVIAVQSFVMENAGRIEEVEINPLLCTPENAIAADALIRLGEYDDG